MKGQLRAELQIKLNFYVLYKNFCTLDYIQTNVFENLMGNYLIPFFIMGDLINCKLKF